MFIQFSHWNLYSDRASDHSLYVVAKSWNQEEVKHLLSEVANFFTLKLLVSFYNLIEVIILCHSCLRDVFKILPVIYDGAFCEKSSILDIW